MYRRALYAIGLALWVLCAPILAGSAFAERRVALVIGNSAYQNAPTLPNPSRDARAIAAMFQKSGYDVVSTAYDLGSLEFKRAIRTFEDAAADADIAVVYYAGHGIEIHGVNYVVPVDAKLASDRDADDEAIPLERLVESVDGAKKLRVIILDACRDNPFSRTMKQQRVAMRGITAGLSAVEPTGINTLVAYAAKAGSQAEDGNGDHSPFATALMDNLFVPGLDVRLAFGRVRDDVLKKTANRQEPFVYGSLGGATVALVPAPDKPVAATAVDAAGDRKDYELVAQVNTRGAFQIYLTQHPTGFYAELARQQIAKLDADVTTTGAIPAGAPKPTLVSTASSQNSPAPSPSPAPRDTVVASLEPQKPPSPSGPTAEEDRAWNKIKDSSNEADYQGFIKKYPTSVLANIAQSHVEAIERAAKDQAAKAEAERQAQLAEAKRQAEAAARQKAQQEAALATAQQAAKAAAQAKAVAEREAALKRDEEAHQAAMAALADAAAKQQTAADAAKKQTQEAAAQTAAKQAAQAAEQAAALAAAQQAAKAAELARLNAERAAQAQQEVTCKNEQDRLTGLQAQGSKARDDLKKLQHGLTCDRLRPLVTAALEKANALPDANTPAQIKSAQQELSRIGCYSGAIDGALSPTTTVAIQHYQSDAHKPVGAVDITDAFIGDLKKQPTRVCPLTCPAGKTANGGTCVADTKPAEKPAPVAHRDEKPSKKIAAKPEPRREVEEAPRPAPQPHVVEQASSGGGGGGGHGTMIGVGF